MATSGSTNLSVNVSGQTVAAQQTSTATVGSITYTFTGVGAEFSKFTGSSFGNTIFYASASGGLSFTGQGASNALDLFATTSPTVEVAGGQVSLGASGTDAFSGFRAFVGSSNGSTTFQPDASVPSNFVGQGTGNTLDLSSSTSPQVNAATGTATLGAVTEIFSDIHRFVGSSSGSTTFRPDATSSYAFTGQGSGNKLDLSATSSPVVDTSVGHATYGGVTTNYSGIQSFVGSTSGFTTFKASTGGYAFTGLGSANLLDLTGAPASSSIDASLGSASMSGGGMISFSDVNAFIGSSQGSTTFIAGSSSESFADPDSTGGDTVDFSSVSSSGSTRVYVNLSGISVNGQPTSTAQVGPIRYTFTSGASDFSKFIGSPNADTFIPGPTSDVSLTGQGSATTLDLTQATSKVTLNLGVSTPQVTGGAGTLTITPGTIQTVIGSNVGNRILAGPGSVTLVGGSGTDWLQAGSGDDTLMAGAGPTTLVGASGRATMTGGKGVDLFRPGKGGGSMIDHAGVGTLDLAHATAAVHVNLGSTSYTTRSHVVLKADLATGGGGKPYTVLGLTNITGSSHRDVLRLGGAPGTIRAGKAKGVELIGSSAWGSMLYGGPGGDTFTSVAANDHMLGGKGNDTFYANNGRVDFEKGGGGPTPPTSTASTCSTRRSPRSRSCTSPRTANDASCSVGPWHCHG